MTTPRRSTDGKFFAVATLLSLLLSLLITLPSVARTIELSDLSDLVRVSSPRISPDGARVAYAVARPDYEANRFEQHLHLLTLESGESRQLTHDRPGVRSPRWSPDGTTLAFLATAGAGEEATTQVFLLPIAGGEARAATSAPEGVAAYEWHPSGDRLIYLAAEPHDSPDAPTDEDPTEGPERHNRSFVVGHHDYLAQEAPAPLHLWIEPLDDGPTERIEVDGVVATTGLLSFFTVSPDGSAVAFTGSPVTSAGDATDVAFHVIDLESGRLRDFGENLALVSSGRFSPDGRKLAYSHAVSGRPYYSAHDIFVASAAGSPGRNATAELDRTFYGALWMPNGKELLLGAADGTRQSLWVQRISGDPAEATRRLDLGDLNPASGYAGPDADIGPDGALAFVASTSSRPAELYYMESIDASPRRLTDLNGALAELDLGEVEPISWRTPDGFTPDGTVTLPPGYDGRSTLPVVLKIHGGPMSSSTLEFDALGQLLASRGWIVFEPNYRGSDNLGDTFQSAIIGDAGVGPGRDVMAGLAALRARYATDPAKTAVSGWSYGGYMTSWLIGNYPDAWAAAVAGAPVTDYVDQYTLSDVNNLFSWGFPELPWSTAGQTLWREQSPIAHLHRATTPTLVLCDTGDRRVPITESYKLYHALEDRDVPVEFVAYPVPGHFPGDPVHIRDVYRRWGDWIARWFEN